MKKFLIIIIIVFISCKEAPKSDNTSSSVDGIEASHDNIQLEVYDYDGLEPLINKKDDEIHVVNFWATWCAPCVKELPYFEKINSEYKDIDMLLVSLDFPRQYEKKLKPFLKEKQLQSKVVCLNDVDQNRWIPAIDSLWSGALPATIIYKGDKRKFFEKSFTYEELEYEIKQFLNYIMI